MFVLKVAKGFNSNRFYMKGYREHTINDVMNGYGYAIRLFDDKSETCIVIPDGRVLRLPNEVDSNTKRTEVSFYNIQDIYGYIKSVRTMDGNWIATRKNPQSKLLKVRLIPKINKAK